MIGVDLLVSEVEVEISIDNLWHFLALFSMEHDVIEWKWNWKPCCFIKERALKSHCQSLRQFLFWFVRRNENWNFAKDYYRLSSASTSKPSSNRRFQWWRRPAEKSKLSFWLPYVTSCTPTVYLLKSYTRTSFVNFFVNMNFFGQFIVKTQEIPHWNFLWTHLLVYEWILEHVDAPIRYFK